MSELNKPELEALMRGIMGDYMKEQFSHVKKNNNEENNSFVYFEKNTLNALMDHLLAGEKQRGSVVESDDFELKILEELEQVLALNKKELEGVIRNLKNLL